MRGALTVSLCLRKIFSPVTNPPQDESDKDDTSCSVNLVWFYKYVDQLLEFIDAGGGSYELRFPVTCHSVAVYIRQTKKIGSFF